MTSIQLPEDPLETFTDQLVAMAERFDVEPENNNPEATRLGTVVSDGSQSPPSVVSDIGTFDPETGERLPGTGYRYLWNTRTGERITVHRNQLVGRNSVLLRVHRDKAYPEWEGKPLFSRKPTGKVARGQAPCLLYPGIAKCLACGEAHEPHPERWFERIPGIKRCMSAHLANPFQARRHLQFRHPTEFQVITDARQQAERDEDRKLRREELAAQREIVQAVTQRETVTPVGTRTPTQRRKTV